MAAVFDLRVIHGVKLILQPAPLPGTHLAPLAAIRRGHPVIALRSLALRLPTRFCLLTVAIAAAAAPAATAAPTRSRQHHLELDQAHLGLLLEPHAVVE